jgi:hypothetical protein
MEGECEVRKGLTDYCEVKEDKKTNGGREGEEPGYYTPQKSSKCGTAHYLFIHI